MTMIRLERWHDIRPNDVERMDDRWAYGGGDREEDPTARWIEHPLHDQPVKLLAREVPTLGIAVPMEGPAGPWRIFDVDQGRYEEHHPMDFVPDGADPEWLSPQLRDWLALKQVPFKRFLAELGMGDGKRRLEPLFRFTIVEWVWRDGEKEAVFDNGLACPGPPGPGQSASLDWEDLLGLSVSE